MFDRWRKARWETTYRKIVVPDQEQAVSLRLLSILETSGWLNLLPLLVFSPLAFSTSQMLLRECLIVLRHNHPFHLLGVLECLVFLSLCESVYVVDWSTQPHSSFFLTEDAYGFVVTNNFSCSASAA